MPRPQGALETIAPVKGAGEYRASVQGSLTLRCPAGASKGGAGAPVLLPHFVRARAWLSFLMGRPTGQTSWTKPLSTLTRLLSIRE